MRRKVPWKFKVADLSEIAERTPELLAYLEELAKTARYSRKFLESAAQELGWKKIQSLVAAKQPTLPNIKRGDFGEALSVAVLAEFDAYIVPVPKLRYKITKNQTLPSTDAVAFKVKDGRITEVSFVESKL